MSGDAYTENAGTSKKNNKILTEGGTGVIAHNLLENYGFEGESSAWTQFTVSGGTYSSVNTSEQRYTGNRSLKLVSSAAGENYGITERQLTIISAGTYTLSARVKVTAMGTLPNKDAGFKIAISTSNGTILSESRMLKETTDSQFDNGWVRLDCTYTSDSLSSVYARLILTGVTGTVYIDDVQLEMNEAASPCNLLKNSTFSQNINHWSGNGSSVSWIKPNGAVGKVLGLTGDLVSESYAKQTVNINLPGSETYVLSGWAYANSLPLEAGGNPEFRLGATVVYSDGTTDNFSKDFNYRASGLWQYLCVAIVPRFPTKRVAKISVFISYTRNANNAYFCDISLIREGARCYTYDEEGRIIAVNKSNTDEISNVYSGGDLISSSGSANGLYTYEYDGKHNITKASNNGLDLNLSYDANGNAVQTILTGSDGLTYMQTNATYTDSGTKLLSVTDNIGNTVNYGYNKSKNLLSSISTPVSNTANAEYSRVYYSYNNSDQLIKTSFTRQSIYFATLLKYEYDKGLISKITREKCDTTSPGYLPQIYSFTYNDIGQKTSTKVGDRTLATYLYDAATHNQSKMTYGNGSYVSYTYDNQNRVKTVKYQDTLTTVTYDYDYLGNIAGARVTQPGKEPAAYKYEYDTLGRLIRCVQTEGNEVVQQLEDSYDSKNRLTRHKYYDGENGLEGAYTYNDGGLVTGYAIKKNGVTDESIFYRYDALNRCTYRSSALSSPGYLSRTYTYEAGASENQTTSKIKNIKYSFTETKEQSEISYGYDNIGNITTALMRMPGVGDLINSGYQYDRDNQLVFESRDCFGTDASTTFYEYDNFGNITWVRTFRGNGYEGISDAMNSGTLMHVDAYTYGNTEWRDLLTAFEGHEITYDEIGNPLSYYNGQEYEFTWENGRRLRRAEVNGENLLYEYNENGIRTEKRSVGKYTDSYRLDGNKVVEMKRSYTGSTRTDRYVFYYDESGAPYAFDAYVNGAATKRYHYITSLQGDVLQLSDESNRIIACYSYDVWGKLFAVTDENGDEISDTSHIAYANPIRYRGYFYDSETKLYYCGSRYYDPQIRRFINADGYVSTGDGFMGYNMFTYCANNPVINIDPVGSCKVNYALKSGKEDCGNPNCFMSSKFNTFSIYLVNISVSTEITESPNDDISFALHDNHRYDSKNDFHEQILAVELSKPSFDLEECSVGIGGIEADFMTGGWEYEYCDISLLDFGHAEAGIKFSEGDIQLGAMASVYSPSVEFSIGSISIGIGAEVCAIGGGINYNSGSFSVKGAAFWEWKF